MTDSSEQPPTQAPYQPGSPPPQGPGAPQPGQPPTAGRGLGIAGFVLGVWAIVLSFIPCLGMYAIFPGVVGIILSCISIKQASGAGAPKGLAIAGLVCAIIGTLVAYGQYQAVNKAADDLKKIGKDFDSDMKKINKDFERDMDKARKELKEDLEKSK